MYFIVLGDVSDAEGTEDGTTESEREERGEEKGKVPSDVEDTSRNIVLRPVAKRGVQNEPWDLSTRKRARLE